MSALRLTMPSAGDAEKQTPTLSTDAIPNASCAEAVTLRPPRSASENSRRRTWSGADGGNAPAPRRVRDRPSPSTTTIFRPWRPRIKLSSHRLNADPPAAAPGPRRDPDLVAAPEAVGGAVPSPGSGPGQDPESDPVPGPHPDPEAVRIPETSQHPDISPPLHVAGGNRSSLGPIWCVPTPAPILGPLRALVTTRSQSKLGTRKSYAYAKRTTILSK